MSEQTTISVILGKGLQVKYFDFTQANTQAQFSNENMVTALQSVIETAKKSIAEIEKDVREHLAEEIYNDHFERLTADDQAYIVIQAEKELKVHQ